MLRDLRLGNIDIIVGINLLREGLDLPEVSLIAILDADKQGFLRSRDALIQTIGRAARNVNGHVIMYGDNMTDAMKQAISETERRRKIQQEYNEAHGIEPASIKKEIVDIIEREYLNENPLMAFVADYSEKYRSNNLGELKELRETLKKDMLEAADKLEFEKAALLRDRIIELRKDQELLEPSIKR